MQWMAGAGDYQLTGEFESDLNRFILLENMEEEERKGKEFEQILEDENISPKESKTYEELCFIFHLWIEKMPKSMSKKKQRN